MVVRQVAWRVFLIAAVSSVCVDGRRLSTRRDGVLCPVKAVPFNFTWQYKAKRCSECNSIVAWNEQLLKKVFESIECESGEMQNIPQCKPYVGSLIGKLCSCVPADGVSLLGFRMGSMIDTECSAEACFRKFVWLHEKQVNFSTKFNPDVLENPSRLCQACRDASPAELQAKSCTSVRFGLGQRSSAPGRATKGNDNVIPAFEDATVDVAAESVAGGEGVFINTERNETSEDATVETVAAAVAKADEGVFINAERDEPLEELEGLNAIPHPTAAPTTLAPTTPEPTAPKPTPVQTPLAISRASIVCSEKKMRNQQWVDIKPLLELLVANAFKEQLASKHTFDDRANMNKFGQYIMRQLYKQSETLMAASLSARLVLAQGGDDLPTGASAAGFYLVSCDVSQMPSILASSISVTLMFDIATTTTTTTDFNSHRRGIDYHGSSNGLPTNDRNYDVDLNQGTFHAGSGYYHDPFDRWIPGTR